MKRKRGMRNGFVIIICILMIAGCSSKDVTQNDTLPNNTAQAIPTMPSGSGEKVEYKYGFGLNNIADEQNIIYDGNPVELEFLVDNGGAGFHVGILMFINGQFQPYEAKSKTIEPYPDVFEVRKETKEIYQVSFTPEFGQAGETLNVRFLFLLNPDTIPDKSNFEYGNNTSMSQILVRELNILKDTGQNMPELSDVEAAEMTREEADSKMRTDPGGVSRSKLNEIEFKLLNNDKSETKYIEASGGRLTFEIEGCGGNSEAYVLTAFINGRAVDYSYFGSRFNILQGTYINRSSFSIAVKELDQDKYRLGEYNSMYVIAVPVSGNITSRSCQIPVITYR